MDKYEESVLEYITAETHRFVNPQFDIQYQDKEGGSCPDFVVIDYKDKTIYIVEVSIASNISGLIEKVKERQVRWISPIKNHFYELNHEFKKWDYRITIFVRDTNKNQFQSKFDSSPDVSVKSIEDISFPHLWIWNGNKPNNSLR